MRNGIWIVHFDGKKLFKKRLFFKILKRNKQHSKTLTIFFTQSLVMYFMCSPYPFGVPIVSISKQFKALMYENVMDYKICSTIGHNSKT